MKIWNLREQKNLNIEKIIFKVVQMKFLAMHITNQKLSFDIFKVGNLHIFMEHDLNILMIFGIKKINNFDPYNVFLAIATNIPSDLRLVLCSRVTYHKSSDKKIKIFECIKRISPDNTIQTSRTSNERSNLRREPTTRVC